MLGNQQKILKPLAISSWIKAHFPNSWSKIKNKNVLGTKSQLKSTLFTL